MTALLQTYAFIRQALATDSRLCLASAIAWLDPMCKDTDNEEWGNLYDEDGTLTEALHITRKAFPDVYLQTVQAIRNGASYDQLEHLICDEISARGIPLDHLQWIGYGVPMPAYGAELEDTDFYTNHPNTVPVLACFGVSPEPSNYRINIPKCVYQAGHYIATDLRHHPDERYRQISWLMQWLFGCSGNSCVDMTHETMCEFQPLSWEEDERAFAIDIIEEAEGIMSDAMAGLTFLNNQPDLLNDLQRNIQKIYKAIKKQKGKRHEQHFKLAWTHLADSVDRTTESVT